MQQELFLVNGRKYKSYELTDNELIDLLDGRHGELTDGQRKELEKVLRGRFKANNYIRDGEGNEELFARTFGNFVNGKISNYAKVGKKMAQEHRYLQQEMFKVCLAYIKQLADSFSFDARNESAVKTSRYIVEKLKEENLI